MPLDPQTGRNSRLQNLNSQIEPVFSSEHSPKFMARSEVESHFANRNMHSFLVRDSQKIGNFSHNNLEAKNVWEDSNELYKEPN